MGIIILGFVIGVIGCCIVKEHYLGGVICFVVGGIVLLCSMAVLGNNYFDDKRLCIEYQNDKTYVESCYDNKYLSSSERSKVNEIIIHDNSIIQTSKAFKSDFWIGVFQYQNVANLEPFDAKRIPVTNSMVTVNSKENN